MFGLGIGEMIALVIIILVVFSASRMSALGNALGKFVYSFKKAAKGNDFVDVPPPPKHLTRGAVDAEIVDRSKK